MTDELRNAVIAILNEAKEQESWHIALNAIRDGHENHKYLHVSIAIHRLIRLEAATFDIAAQGGEWFRSAGLAEYKVDDDKRT